MTRALFVTGTGTDVGKTYVCGLLLKNLVQAGLRAGYFKLAASGNAVDASGQPLPGDPAAVRARSGLEQELADMCPFVYREAVSPHLAARWENRPFDPELAAAHYARLCRRYDYLLVEGAGGIFCPLRWDGDRHYAQHEFVQAHALPCLVVADAGLGCLNALVLTVAYIRQLGLTPCGIILNRCRGDSPLHRDNRAMAAGLTALPVLASVSEGAAELGLAANTLANLFR